jgi:hypothetical protein
MAAFVLAWALAAAASAAAQHAVFAPPAADVCTPDASNVTDPVRIDEYKLGRPGSSH